MTQLPQKMLEELQRRNYSHRTAKTYLRIVREFAEYFHLSPDKLGPEQIRQYQAHLLQTKKLAASTAAQHASALRFLFIKTLRRHFLSEFIPMPKCPKRLPTVFSPVSCYSDSSPGHLPHRSTHGAGEQSSKRRSKTHSSPASAAPAASSKSPYAPA